MGALSLVRQQSVAVILSLIPRLLAGGAQWLQHQGLCEGHLEPHCCELHLRDPHPNEPSPRDSCLHPAQTC